MSAPDDSRESEARHIASLEGAITSLALTTDSSESVLSDGLERLRLIAFLHHAVALLLAPLPSHSNGQAVRIRRKSDTGDRGVRCEIERFDLLEDAVSHMRVALEIYNEISHTRALHMEEYKRALHNAAILYGTRLRFFSSMSTNAIAAICSKQAEAEGSDLKLPPGFLSVSNELSCMIVVLRTLFGLYGENDGSEDRARVCLQLGRCYFAQRSGDRCTCLNSSIYFLRLAKEKLVDSPSHIPAVLRSMVLGNLGLALCALGERSVTEAQSLLESAVAIADDLESDGTQSFLVGEPREELSSFLFVLGALLSRERLSDPKAMDRSIHVVERALSLNATPRGSEQLGSLWQLRGRLAAQRMDFVGVDAARDRAIAIFRTSLASLEPGWKEDLRLLTRQQVLRNAILVRSIASRSLNYLRHAFLLGEALVERQGTLSEEAIGLWERVLSTCRTIVKSLTDGLLSQRVKIVACATELGFAEALRFAHPQRAIFHAQQAVRLASTPMMQSAAQGVLGNARLSLARLGISGPARSTQVEQALEALSAAVAFLQESANERAVAVAASDDVLVREPVRALLCHALGLANQLRSRGSRTENLEHALRWYEMAAENLVNSPPVDVRLYAQCIAQQGTIYLQRVGGDREQNIDHAMKCFANALDVFSALGCEREVAMTHNNIALAWLRRTSGNQSWGVSRAIVHAEAAIEAAEKKGRSKDNEEIDWADVELARAQYNLGRGLLSRGRLRRGSKQRQDMVSAIRHLEEAGWLEIQSEDVFFQAIIAVTLGTAYRTFAETAATADTDRWDAFEAAIEYFDWGLVLVDVCRAGVDANDYPGKRWLQEAFVELYEGAVAVCFSLSRRPGSDIRSEAWRRRALEYVERSKGRNLAEMLRQTTPQPHPISEQDESPLSPLFEGHFGPFDPQNRSSYFPQRRQRIRQRKSLRRNDLLGLVRMRRNERKKELRDAPQGEGEGVRFHFEELRLVFATSLPERSSAIFSLDPHMVLCEWFVTAHDEIYLFVVRPVDGVLCVGVERWLGAEQLHDWALNHVNELGRIERLADPTNGGALHKDRLAFLARSLRMPAVLEEPDVHQVVLVPHRFLHLVPLHLLPVGDSGEPLLELCPEGVCFAPSSAVLLQLRYREMYRRDLRRGSVEGRGPLKKTAPDNADLCVVTVNAGEREELLWSSAEVKAVSSFYSCSCSGHHRRQVHLEGSAARADAFRRCGYPGDVLSNVLGDATHIHFSCHGAFHWTLPEESCLRLAGGTRLRPRDAARLPLNRCRLVSLSACMTGIADISSKSDEYVGLPAGFLVAGSSAVVASLWPVPELATAILMTKLTEELVGDPPCFKKGDQSDGGQRVSVAKALATAQRWLKTRPPDVVSAYAAANGLGLSSHELENATARQRAGTTSKVLHVQDRTWNSEDLDFDESREVFGEEAAAFSGSFFWGAFVVVGGLWS